MKNKFKKIKIFLKELFEELKIKDPTARYVFWVLAGTWLGIMLAFLLIYFTT